MTAKYTFFIGLNDKDTKQQVVSTVDAYHVVENIFRLTVPTVQLPVDAACILTKTEPL